MTLISIHHFRDEKSIKRVENQLEDETHKMSIMNNIETAKLYLRLNRTIMDFIQREIIHG